MGGGLRRQAPLAGVLMLATIEGAAVFPGLAVHPRIVGDVGRLNKEQRIVLFAVPEAAAVPSPPGLDRL